MQPDQSSVIIRRRGVWGYAFDVEVGGEVAAHIKLDTWKRGATITCGDREYFCTVSGITTIRYELWRGDERLAVGTRKSVSLQPTIGLDMAGGAFEVRKVGTFKTYHGLFFRDQEVGAIPRLKGFLDATAEATLPTGMPPLSKAFIAYLVITRWQAEKG